MLPHFYAKGRGGRGEANRKKESPIYSNRLQSKKECVVVFVVVAAAYLYSKCLRARTREAVDPFSLLRISKEVEEGKQASELQRQRRLREGEGDSAARSSPRDKKAGRRKGEEGGGEKGVKGTVSRQTNTDKDRNVKGKKNNKRRRPPSSPWVVSHLSSSSSKD